MALTAKSLSRAMGGALPLSRYQQMLPYVTQALLEANCTTQKRASMYLAQIGHESLGLRYMEEIASGKAYNGRRDLGNTRPGDGPRFKGSGPLQLTGRHNFTAFSKWAHKRGLSPGNSLYFVNNPGKVRTIKYGFLAATWYWVAARPKLNSYADAGNLTAATRAINGGLNGLADRRRRWNKCRKMGNKVIPSKAKAAGSSKAPAAKKKKAGTFTTGGTRLAMGDVVSKGTRVKFRGRLTNTGGGYPGCACPCLTHVVVLAEALLQQRGELKPGQKLQFYQGCWSSGVAASAGTHGGGGVLDVKVAGYTQKGINQVVKAFRQAGAPATWERKMGAKFGNMKTRHLHAVVAGCPHVSSGARKQLTSVRNGRNGLANQRADYGPKVKYRSWRKAWKKYTKKVSGGSVAAVKGFELLKQQKTLYRTKNQTVRGKYKAIRLSNKKKGNLSWTKGGGPKQAWIIFGMEGLSPGESLRVRPYRVDKKKGKTSKHTNYPIVDLPGGNGRIYRSFLFQWDIPSPPKGTKRYVRLKAYSRSGHPVKIRKFKMKRWL